MTYTATPTDTEFFFQAMARAEAAGVPAEWSARNACIASGREIPKDFKINLVPTFIPASTPKRVMSHSYRGQDATGLLATDWAISDYTTWK